MQTLVDLLPTAAVILIAGLGLALAHRVLERGAGASSGDRFRNQLLMLVLTLAAVMLVILVLPMSDTLRGQILSLIGIVISAAIALSATTLVGNAMAGAMLRVVRGFRIGDFIRTEEHFGRVSELGLFHTEIQTENRDLTTIPNIYLVSHPVTTVRSSGTIVSATVSLGYDVPRTRIEGLLLEAARNCALEDPFVKILELSDFSVNYRVSGLLTDVKYLLTVRSRLRASVLDALHGGGIEIVSPTFMNQRVQPEGRVFIPPKNAPVVTTDAVTTQEKVVFDKAEKAESLEGLRGRYRDLGGEIDDLKAEIKASDKGSPEREDLEAKLARRETRRESLAEVIKKREEAAAGE
ncbi:MAG: mechanosensitive ion channel family protein [bacterium]|nr:mechanosensitive ion channel family protein [bacterium]